MISRKSPALERLLDGVHGVVPVETEPSSGAARRSLEQRQRQRERGLAFERGAVPLGVGHLGVFGRIRDEEMERGGPAARARGSRLEERGRRGRPLRDDEDAACRRRRLASTARPSVTSLRVTREVGDDDQDRREEDELVDGRAEAEAAAARGCDR